MTLFTTLTLALLATASQAGEIATFRGTYVEIPIRRAYIPVHGYDTRDSVNLLASGELPNPCYTLSGAYARREPDGSTWSIHQLAFREMNGPCGSQDAVHDPVPFTSEVSMGMLGAGDYHLTYLQPSGSSDRRDFSVEKAKPDAIHQFDYAVIDGVEVPDLPHAYQDIVLTISGTITSSCMDFQRPLPAQKDGDTITILPVLVQSGADCTHADRPFREQIHLGELAPGGYLIHLKSRNGKAVNRLIDVRR